MPEAQPTPAVEPVPIHVALVRVKESTGAVAKRDEHSSPQARFMFRGIDAVVNAAAPALIAHGVTVLPTLKRVDYSTVQTSNNRTMSLVRVLVRYRFVGPAGDWLDVLVPGEAFDSGDKATAKAMSVAYRIALLQALSLPTDEPDPDHEAHEIAGPVQPVQRARRRRGQPEQQQPEQQRLEIPSEDKVAEWLGSIVAAVTNYPRGDERDPALREVWADALRYDVANLYVSVPETWAVAAPEPEMKIGPLIGLARSLPQPKPVTQ